MTCRSLLCLTSLLVVVDAQDFLAIRSKEASVPLALPALTYRYTVFAAAVPEAASKFFERYTGATRLSPSEMQLAEAATGSRLMYGDGAYSDVYFVNDPSLPQGAEGPTAFGKKVDETHTMAQDDWDWHQDWHVAFSVTDIDAVAARLLRDNVPFVNRGSLYFAIPHTGVTVQVLGHATLYWTESFLFCRHTDDATSGLMKPYATNVSSIEEALARPLPVFVPSHQSLTASDAKANAKWAYRFLNVTHIDEETRPGESHAYAGGTCAEIAWMEISPGGWELHFIEQYVKRQGKVKVADHEAMVNDLHGDLLKRDAYMQFRVGFSVQDLNTYVSVLKDAGERFLLERDAKGAQRLYVASPNGYIFELYQVSSSLSGKESGQSAIVAALHE